MRGRLLHAGLVALTVFIACSGGAGVGASGGTSSGSGASSHGGSTPEGGSPSGGSTPVPDAGPMDANQPDGTGEGGSSPEGGADGSSPDGSGPSVVSAPAIACTDTIANVYVTPTNLPPMTLATRGDVVRCAFDSTLPLATVSAEVAAKGITTLMKTDVNLYRVEFRTTRGDGSAGASAARVYLPATPAALPLPVITVGHPTDGIAPSCAPSADPTSNQDLALPWAGLGYAVIVPDYAGLGNEGVQAYLDNHDQAYSVLDGARALRKLLPPAALSQQVLAVGYSQGGGAVLAAQALAPTYGADGTLAGVVAFAPEWPTRLNSFGYVNELENPNELTILTGISENVVTVMRTFAYFYNDVGASHEGDGFPAANQAGIDNAVETLCQTPLGGYLQINEPHVGDIFDPTLRTTLLACIADASPDAGIDAGTDAGCVDPGKSMYGFLTNNLLAADPNGPPILYVQGLSDIIMPPASEAACNIDKLMKDGVTPQVCTDVQAQHTDVVGRNMDFALGWAFAVLAGSPTPGCSSAGMPACTP